MGLSQMLILLPNLQLLLRKKSCKLIVLRQEALYFTSKALWGISRISMRLTSIMWPDPYFLALDCTRL
jgi:hypothetical protein